MTDSNFEKEIESMIKGLTNSVVPLSNDDFQAILDAFVNYDDLTDSDLSNLQSLSPPKQVNTFFDDLNMAFSLDEKIKKVLKNLDLNQAQSNEVTGIVIAFLSALTIAKPLRNKYFRREVLSTPTNEEYKKDQVEQVKEVLNIPDTGLDSIFNSVRVQFNLDKLHHCMDHGLTDIAKQMDCNINFYEQYFYVTTKKTFSKYKTNYWTDCISLLKEVRSLAPHLFHLKIDFCIDDKASIKQRLLAYERSIFKTVTQ